MPGKEISSLRPEITDAILKALKQGKIQGKK